MSLGKKQEKFSLMKADLIQYMYNMGYKVRTGDVWASDGIKEAERVLKFVQRQCRGSIDVSVESLAKLIRRHSHNSKHYLKLAVDINLFLNGEYLSKTEDHKIFGEYWEELGGIWGGRFDDGNHYEL